MKKKILLSLGAIALLFFGVLLIIPLFLEAKIGTLLKQNVNAQIEGTFDFDKASLSLISSFPRAKLSLNNPYLLTQQPFEGDTLFFAEALELEMGIAQLFKGADEPIIIEDIGLSAPKLQLQVNGDDVANYDIARETTVTTDSESQKEEFSFSLKSYEISNADITYSSTASGIALDIRIDEHKGSGDLSLSDSRLDTQTKGQISLELDSIAYLNKTPFSLQALIGMDLEQYTYRFLENQAILNQLALVFEGEMQLKEEGVEMDITFNAPEGQFADFLALLPEAYVKDMQQIKATGDFEVSGFVKGVSSEESMPEFGVGIKSNNATAQYADMPRAIEGISFIAGIGNNSGNGSKINLEVKNASFQIGEDTFKLNALIKDVLGERITGMSLRTNMNLSRLGEAYPLPDEIGLSGSLNTDVTASFNEAMLKQKAYGQIQLDGTAALKDFVYTGPEFAAPLKLEVMKANLSRDRMLIEAARGSMGQSDFGFSGTLQPVLGYLLGESDLQGSLNLASNTFVVSDFMTPSADTQEVPVDSIAAFRIPTDLNLEARTQAKKVIYDDLEMEDFKGKIRLKEGGITFEEVTTGFFKGKLALQGSIDTREEQPQFAMALDLEQLQIRQAFEAMELFQALAPVARALEGKFSSQLVLAGALDSNFSPVLSSLTGDVQAEVLTADMNSERLPVLSGLNNTFNFFDVDKLDLRGLKTALAFEDGKVRVKPFSFQYEDIAVRVDGGHGFDRSLNYQLTLDVPTKYLGSEVQGLVASIGQQELQDLTLPVNVGIEGSHTSPKISTDLTSGMENLTKKLVELQKQKLLNKGRDQVQSLIGDVLQKPTDSVREEKGGDVLKGVLKGLTTKSKDSIDQDTLKKEENPLEEKAKGLLKGLLKNKKKDTAKAGN
ncbi:MAG: AsmA-like C-terminal region-containing protein [Eudoraea sp.]|nr:AsmA-like C-terminal region-containing protein [Eudoraea sp.]